MVQANFSKISTSTTVQSAKDIRSEERRVGKECGS